MTGACIVCRVVSTAARFQEMGLITISHFLCLGKHTILDAISLEILQLAWKRLQINYVGELSDSFKLLSAGKLFSLLLKTSWLFKIFKTLYLQETTIVLCGVVVCALRVYWET